MRSLRPSLQVPILARVRALEQRLPSAERALRKQLDDPLPSAGIGTGTLLSRVDALERAVDTLLRVQEQVMEETAQRGGAAQATTSMGCCGCTIM